MRDWKLAALGFLALATGVGCAHVEAPTGGPEIREPLRVTAVQPDSLAVVPQFRGPVVLQFSRRLSERGLDDAVLVSPRTSGVSVGHRGRELRVALREGWEPGRVYQVTVLPEIQDLWNNRLEQAVTHVFSTGAPIPDTRVDGTAVDRITGRPEVAIRVEAILTPDSLVYATRTDSAGAFTFAQLPEGTYRIRAYRDLNRDRALDPFEPRDTTAAQLASGDAAAVRLSVVAPDTTPPVVVSARIERETIELQFDDYLDPQQVLSPGQVQIRDAAGNPIPVRRLAVGPLAPVAADTVAPDPEQPPPPPDVAVADTALAGAAPPAERLPSQTLTVEPGTPLTPGTEYRIRVENVRNVFGLTGGGEASVTPPAAPPVEP
ncbi:MAG: carboxypeptidase regulatory-like domain-containing protein [Gemmatimonadetes bacterium]|nr:carboxypeptidase regulatory-like domain-containing protein [Gemmatimonadota bacterium]